MSPAPALRLAFALLAAPAAAMPAGPQASDVAIPTGIVVSAKPPRVSTGPAIAEIQIVRENVFNPSVPGEDWWPFRAANKLHFVTREKVVRDELLFAPGDRWDDLTALESERNLRSNYPFRYAEIVKKPRSDGKVDVLVRTQDAWSTNPRLAFGASGGHSSASIGLEEDNLAGYGKAVSYIHTQGDSVSGSVHSDAYSYGDPRFLGTRLGLAGNLTKTQDGDSELADLTRPFYSLETEHAMTARWSNSNAIGTEVQDAADYSRYFQRRRVVDADYGWRLPQDRWAVQRLELGWYDDRQVYSETSSFPGTLPGTLPADVNLSGPTVAYSLIQPRYIKETNINRMERVEDFNLGNELRVRTGYMARGTGSDQDRWIFNVTDQQGLDLGPHRFMLAGVGVSGRIFDDKWENGLATANLNFFWKNWFWSRERTLVVHVEGAQGRRLDRENQIYLGGSNGLRGYKDQSFVGGRSVLANVEDRFFWDREFLHLARFGGAVFAESGAVVPEGSGFSAPRFKSDVGLGLRGAATRSTSGGVVRMDLAYALNPGPGGSRWVISIRAGQAFTFFNSASQGVSTSPGSPL